MPMNTRRSPRYSASLMGATLPHALDGNMHFDGLSTTRLNGTIATVNLGELPTAKFTGTVATVNLGELPTEKFTGTVATTNLGELPTAKFTGTVATVNLGELPTEKLTGTISTAQLGFGTWEKLAEVKTTASESVIDFTNLNINNDFAYMLVCAIQNPTAESGIRLLPNGDTTLTNYYTQQLAADGTSQSPARLNEPRVCWVFEGSSSTAYAIVQKRKKGTLHFLDFYSLETRGEGPTVANVINACVGTIVTTPTDNIDRLTLRSGVTGAIGTGSSFMFCKLKTK